MWRRYLSGNGTAREYLNKWIDTECNLYSVNVIIKVTLFNELNKVESFNANEKVRGYNGAFMIFMKELLQEYDNEDTKNKTKYEKFYDILNTLDGRWELPETHINYSYDYPLSKMLMERDKILFYSR